MVPRCASLTALALIVLILMAGHRSAVYSMYSRQGRVSGSRAEQGRGTQTQTHTAAAEALKRPAKLSRSLLSVEARNL